MLARENIFSTSNKITSVCRLFSYGHLRWCP